MRSLYGLLSFFLNAMQLKSFAMHKRLLGMDEKSCGYSSYFFNCNKTKDHCVTGQADLIRNICIGVAVILVTRPFKFAEKNPSSDC